jgi:hypothetical protein
VLLSPKAAEQIDRLIAQGVLVHDATTQIKRGWAV